MITHHTVQTGDGWYKIATTLAPLATKAQQQAFAELIARANGALLSTPLFPGRILMYDTATVPAPVPPPPPPPPPVGSLPTWDTVGIPAGVTATLRSVGAATLRTSTLPGTTETIDGVAYKVITEVDFTFTGGIVQRDDPNVQFRRCRFRSLSGETSNTMAMVQANMAGTTWLDQCDQDGGPVQNRGVSGDTGHIRITRSRATRIGNAAWEKNDRQGLWDLFVDRCFVKGVDNWPPADHADGIQFGCGRNFTCTNTVVEMPNWRTPADAAAQNWGAAANSCLGIWAEGGGSVVGDVLIQNVRLTGAGTNIYLEAKNPGTFRGAVVVRDALLGRFNAGGGRYLSTSGRPSQLVWENVRDVDSGALIAL